MSRGRSGFTLIELLIVVVVLGVLAVIAIPRLNKARERSFMAAIRSDLENMALSQAVYHDDYNIYADDPVNLDQSFTTGVNISINENTGQGWAATATHDGLAGQSCGMFYGNGSPANATPATTAGAVYCTIY